MLVTIQAFNAGRVSIPNHVIETIPKERRKNLTAYVIAQTGDHKINVIDPESQSAITKVYKWGTNTIQALVSMVKGLPFFKDHGVYTNSHEGRQERGRVEAAYDTEIDGVPSTVVIGSFDEKPVEDVVSIEAQVDTVSDTGNKEIVKGIRDVTAIAMGSKAKGDTPGFSGAERLAYIQCFTSTASVSQNGGNEMEVTLGDVKNFIRSQQVLPSQLYGTPELQEDPKLWDGVRAHFDKKVQDGVKSKDEELTQVKSELDKYKRAEQQKKGKEQVLAKIDEGSYTDLQKDFYKKRLDRYDKDLDEKGVETFFDVAKQDWEDFGDLSKKLSKSESPNSTEKVEEENDLVESIVDEVLTGKTEE